MRTQNIKTLIICMVTFLTLLVSLSSEALARRPDDHHKRQRVDHSQNLPQTRKAMTRVDRSILEAIADKANEMADEVVEEDQDQEGVESEEMMDLTADNVELVAEFHPNDLKAGIHEVWNDENDPTKYIDDHFSYGSLSFYNVVFNGLFDSKRANGSIPFATKSPWGKQGVDSDEAEVIAKLNLFTRTDWAGSAYYVVEAVLTPNLNSSKAADRIIIQADYDGNFANKNVAEFELTDDDDAQEISVITDPIVVKRELNQEQESDTLGFTVSCDGPNTFSGFRCQGSMQKVRVYRILY